MSASRRALVLAGGGFAANAWETGLISGMATAGLDLRACDLFVGTSSGARVALNLASGTDLKELYQQQLGPLPGPVGSPALVDWQKVRTECAYAKAGGGDSTAILRRVGALALGIAGADNGERRNTVAAQLPRQDWPAKKLSIVAVNAETGQRRIFDRASGVALVDAMVATTAFFGWPPATVEGQPYIDGGFYSSDNADLAAGFEQVIILALRAPAGAIALVPIAEGVSSLRASGSLVAVVHPDEECLAAFASAGSAMNPAVRAPAAKAGRVQGQRFADELRLTFA